MLHSNIELLRHIRDEVSFVLDATKNKTQEELELDPVLSRAVERSLEIIGEASNKLDNEFRASYPHVEWSKIIRTRHRLIHEYFGVDYDIVWLIITEKLPDLLEDVTAIIASNDSPQ